MPELSRRQNLLALKALPAKGPGKGKKRITKLAMAALLLMAAAPLPALADRDDDYQEGVDAYNEHRYATAVRLLQSALHQGYSNPICMLYLAHAYAAQGQYKLALPVYINIRDQFKGSPESEQAAGCVTRVEALLNAPPSQAQPSTQAQHSTQAQVQTKQPAATATNTSRKGKTAGTRPFAKKKVNSPRP